jgi:DNA-directed RNA polymerase specialized sigma24 family protein
MAMHSPANCLDLNSKDVARARRSYDRLYAKYASRLRRHLAYHYSYIIFTELEDIVQNTLLTVWNKREEYHFETDEKFFHVLREIGQNRCIDYTRKRKIALFSQIGPEDGDAIDLPASYDLEATSISKSLCEQLMHAADVEWLRLPAMCTLEEANLRTVCAIMYYDDRESVEVIADTLRSASIGDIQRWLADSATIRLYLYHKLMVKRVQLISVLLKHRFACEAAVNAYWNQLNATQTETRKTLEQVVALMRYFFDMPREAALHDIQQRMPELERSEFEEIANSLALRLPYRGLLANSLSSIAVCSDVNRETLALGEPHFWRRLIFQYAYLVMLQHKDIHERVAPSAADCGHELKRDYITTQISTRRLITALYARWSMLYDSPREQHVA